MNGNVFFIVPVCVEGTWVYGGVACGGRRVHEITFQGKPGKCPAMSKGDSFPWKSHEKATS